MKKVLLLTLSLLLLTAGMAAAAEDWLQIGGTVRKKGKGEAVLAGVSVSVKQGGNRAVTGQDGNYRLSRIKKGNYIFEVTAPGRAAREIEMTVPGATYGIEL